MIVKNSLLFFLFTLSFYAQNDTLAVIKHTEEDIVYPKELKVVYRLLENFLSIEVPNCKSFKASGEGLNLVSNNLYRLIPESGKEVVITINIVLKDNRKVIEKHIFKIKNISGFITTINGKVGVNSIIRMQKVNLKDAIIEVRFEDKNLQFKNKISKFQLKIPNYPSIEVFGNKIDKLTYEKIVRNASLGDQIVICDIKLNVRDSRLNKWTCFKTSPVVAEIF